MKNIEPLGRIGIDAVRDLREWRPIRGWVLKDDGGAVRARQQNLELAARRLGDGDGDAVAAHQRVENLAQRRRPDLTILVFRSGKAGVDEVIHRLRAVAAAKAIGAHRIAAVLAGVVAGAARVPIREAVRIAGAAESRL